MRMSSAKETKYGFERLINLTRAARVTVATYGRPVVGPLSVEEYGWLKALPPANPEQVAGLSFRT